MVVNALEKSDLDKNDALLSQSFAPTLHEVWSRLAVIVEAKRRVVGS